MDNKSQSFLSTSGHCQVPHCGQKIRYEYHVKNLKNQDAPILVVGSTCIGELFGLSDAELKMFNQAEKSFRAISDMIAWRTENIDVCDKLADLKKDNVVVFRPFWEEIEYQALDEEDTEFIRNVNVQDMVDTYEVRYFWNLSDRQAGIRARRLLRSNPENTFLQSMVRGFRLYCVPLKRNNF